MSRMNYFYTSGNFDLKTVRINYANGNVSENSILATKARLVRALKSPKNLGDFNAKIDNREFHHRKSLIQ